MDSFSFNKYASYCIFVYLIVVGFDTKNERHHSLLLCLLMTASDLSDQTKPWDNTKHVAVRRKSLILFLLIGWNIPYRFIFIWRTAYGTCCKECSPLCDRRWSTGSSSHRVTWRSLWDRSQQRWWTGSGPEFRTFRLDSWTTSLSQFTSQSKPEC